MFRTELPLTPHPQQLPPSARVLTIGSCFSDSIGARLTEFKVATMVNPFGTVFNPISACKLLRAAAGEDMDWQQHLVEARGRWQNHDLHAELGADNPVELLQRIQTLTREAGVFLATADAVVLTLGSAFAYRLRETEEIISNCHKLPAEKFDKELLTADDIIAAVAETHAYLRRINPKLRFILTVSPVRHVKDTLVLNSASKAMLRVACHYLSELLPDVTYFPAYELLLDDLRDYRFYAADMLHPSEVAENYVWERFTRTYFDATFGRFKKEWEGIRQSLNHRPLHPAAPEHREFLEATLERLRKVASQADVRMELLHVERELANLPLPVVPAAPEPKDYDDGEERIDIGSFDEEPVVAAKPAATPLPAPAPAATPQQAPADRKPVPTPQTREDSDDDATDRGQARILRPGFGVLLEEEDEEPNISNEPTAAPAQTLVTPDSAYDQAYSAATLAESEQDDLEEEAEDESKGEPERRKKRRSRGGAKRTKRKHARLAAEQTAGDLQADGSVVAVLPASLPAEEAPAQQPATENEAAPSAEELSTQVVYVTEEELRRPRRSPEADMAPKTAATPEEANTAEAAPASAEVPAAEEESGNRRSRNNRRGGKREGTERSGNRPARQPLYAAEAEAAPDATAVTPDPVAEVAPRAASTGGAVPTSQPAPAAEASTTEEVAPAAAAKKPASKRRTSAKSAKTASAEVAAAETTSTATPPLPVAAPETAPSAPANPTPATAAPTGRKPTRRKPAAQAAPATAQPEAAAPTPTPAEPVSAPEPATGAPVKAPARKRAASKAKAAPLPEAPAAVAAPQSATTEAVAPTAKPKAAAKPKSPAKTKPKAKAAAAPQETLPVETPAAKPTAKPPAKSRKATPAAQPATPEPAAKKPAAKKAAARKPAAKKPAARKTTPEPPASESN
ncbi:GSCFA domain-containing protein [Hymenobacter sp. NST-14]|uniref:GSCFA domain-containing protein n=1 Tax=Hymenobacter piscis TaxID=2839984 RepID=UPI001C009FFE|nr:GSCFA domain-containing protein [Hymenobacter piscis]MBT9391618.1 GSCFA domain-containing protein [Hymenobacter piscis]